MDKIHHIAIEVKSIKDTIDWYKKNSSCESFVSRRYMGTSKI